MLQNSISSPNVDQAQRHHMVSPSLSKVKMLRHIRGLKINMYSVFNSRIITPLSKISRNLAMLRVFGMTSRFVLIFDKTITSVSIVCDRSLSLGIFRYSASLPNCIYSVQCVKWNKMIWFCSVIKAPYLDGLHASDINWSYDPITISTQNLSCILLEET